MLRPLPVNRRLFLRRTLAATTVVAAGTSLGVGGVDTHDLEITTVPVTIGLNRPLRVIALGDLHFDPLYEEGWLEQISAHMSALRPDLVLYTGDFVTRTGTRIHDLADLLSRTSARLGAFGVLGNHDHWAGGWEVMAALEKKGIRILWNDYFALPGEEDVYLTGLDSFWAGNPNPGILSRTPVNSRHILLVHEPDSFTQLDDPRIKLQISGHTHGGQVRLPLVGALILPVWGRNFDSGLFARQGRHLYVNRGIGTLTPHVRFGCRPEITVFELT